MSRADVGPYELEKLPPFYLYVDEFQNFANESFASILSEARKYNLALAVAHQYIEQMDDEVKAAVFGNVGTMIVFRVGATDGEIFEKEFAPAFVLDDFVNLSARQIYLRLMIDGVGSKPFSANTLPPIEKPVHSFDQAVIAHTRVTYAKPRFVVEEEIAAFYASNKDKEKTEKSEKKPQANSFSSSGEQKKYNNDQGRGREERQLHVRKITDQTPLPPKKFEPRRDEPAKELTREEVYQKSRNIEEEFHKPPQAKEKASYEERKQKTESPLKPISTPSFDEKPATSLKDALKKALDDHEAEKKRGQDGDTSNNTLKKDPQPSVSPKEVSEDILRKLLED
jgi:hypothetical protein